MVFLWIQQQIVSYILKKGLDKSLPLLFRRDAVITSITISMGRTCSELKIDSVEYLIRKVFGKNKELVQLIMMNYKTNPGIVITKMQEGLIEAGADFGTETSEKIEEISRKFIEIFTEELPKSEKVPISSSQTAEATHRATKDHSGLLNKMIETQEKILEIVNKQSIPEASPKTTASITRDDDADLENSKYKKEIDQAKILLDKEKHETAKVIYEKLLEDFKLDPRVPMLAKFKVYNNLGACLAALGMRNEAARNFRIAFEIMGPTSVIACKNRALASLFEDKPLEGLPFIDAAIAIEPDNNDCINLKATLLRAAGQFQKVIELYTAEGEQNEN